MRLLFALSLLFCVQNLFSQSVTVLEQESGTPLPGANLYTNDGSKSTTTNIEGVAALDIFSKSETILVSYVGYIQKKTTKAAIIAAGNIIYLQEDNNELNEVVLSVAKFEQEQQDITQQVVQLTPEDVEFANPQTAADLLESSGQVYVQKSQLGGGSPMIRGFSTNRLLITVDGVRMNTAIFRSGNLQNVINVDPFAIDRSEVILGPGSVVYGSDAIGGVMNFYTKQPTFSFQEGIAVSGNAYARYSSANTEKTGHIDVNLGNKKWAFLTSVSYSDYDDLRMGSHGPDDYIRSEYVVRQNGQDVVIENENPNEQVPTGFDMLNLMQKVRYMPNATWDFSLGLIYSNTSDYSRYDRLTRKRDGQLRSAAWFYGPQRWFMSNLQASKKGYNTIYDEARITAAFQIFEESRNDRDFGEDILFETDEHVNAYSLGLDFTKELGAHQLFYGAEYVLNTVDSQGSQTNIISGESIPDASRYPDGSTWQSIAGYVSGQFRVSEKVRVQSGLRYSHILVDATFDDRFYNFPFEEANISTGNITGSLGLNWQVNQTLGWKLNLSTAFRAPNIDDVGKVFDSEPGSVVVPNPDLKAEYAYNGELGVTLNFEDVVTLDLATFYTKLDHALVRRDFNLDGQTVIDYQGEPSDVQAIQNAANAEVYGFEAGVDVVVTQNINLRSQLNIVEGNQEEDDGSIAPLRHAAPLFGNTHLVWQNNRLKLDAFAEYNGQFDYNELAPSQQGNAYLYALDGNGNPYAPSWYTVNFASQYQITDAWQASAALENITDQRYRPYSSGISAPGRNLIVAVKYTF